MFDSMIPKDVLFFYEPNLNIGREGPEKKTIYQKILQGRIVKNGYNGFWPFYTWENEIMTVGRSECCEDRMDSRYHDFGFDR